MIAVATVLVYSNTFNASFHLDDLPNIVRNKSLRVLSRQWPPSGNRWLGFLSFALNYQFGGLNVFGYHLVNILIHVCNGLLVFGLAAIALRTPVMRRAEAGPLVRGYLPLAAGLLFALHPVQTQAVTYIVQRYTSLATLLFLLSLLLYALARLSLEAELPSKRRAAFLYVLSVMAAAGAMKTKEISFTLPFAAAGYELLFFRRPRRWLLLVPLAVIALLVPLGLATQGGRSLADSLGDAGHLAAETPDIPRSVYLLTQSRVVVTYLRLLLLPVGQNLDYDFRLSHSLADPSVLFALAVILGVAASTVFFLIRARKTNRAAGILFFFGIGWFFVTLSVESSVIPISDVIFEHRMYLPSAGMAVAIGTALLSAVEHLRLRVSLPIQVTGMLLVTAAPLGVASYTRNFLWKNELTLWSDVVAKSPSKFRPRINLGSAYLSKNRLDDAEREFREAIRLDPSSAEAHNNLGTVCQRKGKIDDALREFRTAVDLDSSLAGALSNMGAVYQARGQFEEAVRMCRAAIRIDPSFVDAYHNLGSALDRQGNLEDALAAFRLAEAQVGPGAPPDSPLQESIATVLRRLGRAGEARRVIERALERDGSNPSLHDDLAILLLEAGEFDQAALEAREAVRLAPEHAPYWETIGEIARARRDPVGQLAALRHAAALDPRFPERDIELGDLEARLGHPQEACAAWERVSRWTENGDLRYRAERQRRTLGCTGAPAGAIARPR